MCHSGENSLPLGEDSGIIFFPCFALSSRRFGFNFAHGEE